tara:strand:- start:775 stop:1902 length:1128 start_codon:yes stop_codon:yes gene_type:complete
MAGSLNPSSKSVYDQIVGSFLGTAQDAGRYLRSTQNPGILDFIEKKSSGALAQPGDVVQMSPKNYNNLGTINANPAPPPRIEEVDDNGFKYNQLMPQGSEIMVNDGSVSPYNTPPPALTNQTEPTPDQGVLSNPSTGNRRDQTPMSFKPQMIGDGEMLMRTGLAGLGANSQGATASMGAMGDMYGAIQDSNRSGINSYNLAMQEAQTKATDAKAKTLAENQQQIGQIDQTVFDMDRALANLEGGMELTGWWDATVGSVWDNFKGNPEAAGRLLLQKLKVDDTLLRVAQTKGAISNKEMDLFMSPAPSNMSDEKVWIKWIKDRKAAIQKVRQRLASGTTVNSAEQASVDQVNMFSSSQSASPSYSPADQALINKYS